MHKYMLELPDDLFAKLKSESAKNRKSIKQFLHELIKEAVKK